jgi:hypothetical protein
VRLDYQPAFGRPEDLAALGQDQLDQTGVASDFRGDTYGFIARLYLSQVPHPALCFRDDLLRADDYLTIDRFRRRGNQ